jgi:O-acetyl-ADP-ribose deacetylase (regulator of RNase III)
LETFDDHCPYLIAAPIMRVPAILEDTSLNPYLAARAALLLTKHGSFEDDSPISEKIRRVAFPALVGEGIPPHVCARQMRAALDAVMGMTPFPRSWHEAVWYQTQI